MPSLDYKLTTDANGDFTDKTLFDPLGWLQLDVTLTATLIPPEGASAKAFVDIESVAEGADKVMKSFVIISGETADLGDWQVDSGEHVLILRGRTEPPLAGTVLSIHAETRG